MKYNKSEIMKRAWNLVKTANVSISVALKAAWATAKAIISAQLESEECLWNNRVKVNDWAKGGHNRTYIALRVYTNAWNLKREISFGYVNNLTGELVTD